VAALLEPPEEELLLEPCPPELEPLLLDEPPDELELLCPPLLLPELALPPEEDELLLELWPPELELLLDELLLWVPELEPPLLEELDELLCAPELELPPEEELLLELCPPELELLLDDPPELLDEPPAAGAWMLASICCLVALAGVGS
jgi:hypothetical protein